MKGCKVHVVEVKEDLYLISSSTSTVMDIFCMDRLSQQGITSLPKRPGFSLFTTNDKAVLVTLVKCETETVWFLIARTLRAPV